MPSLKELKTRKTSVQSTRKITSAMKMIASSKLHHAQMAIHNMLPYSEQMEHILKVFLASMPGTQTIFEEERAEVKHVAMLVFSSNSSLCGAFNSNVIRMTKQVVEEYKAQGITDITIYPLGRKIAEKVVRMGCKSAGDFTDLADKPNAHECSRIAKEISNKFANNEYDKVEMIYHHFKSAGSQVLTRKTFLPIDLSTETIGADNDRDLSSSIATAKAQEYLRKRNKVATKRNQEAVIGLNDDFIVEPDMETVLSLLVPQMLHLMVYTALLDSVASEHAARMVAMQTATDNADQLLEELSLQFNKSRQTAITNELLDIVGGSVNN
ncbi:F0F1 ATP synthase subunit gamma [Hallella colorans]|uniref:F0F1 ATP synthase subunit gamma n=1 Tax=Hallella colorans TaxID=1703337 RepID=UPI00288B6544|nr:F0F1 ATP synthase subunit gamma [Hallella colorans]